MAAEVQGRGDRPDPEQDRPVPVEPAHAIDRRTEQGVRHIFRATDRFISADLLPKNEPDPGLVDLRSVMDDGRILIVNLSKSRIGDGRRGLRERRQLAGVPSRLP
ncbi:MAG: hypothetical protein O3C40_37440 [Planctomycetota bacterium]|nr:hypothetical protein [Planctomycetota bacterium]